MIDTPNARRKRELEFIDEDINKTVLLTQRPYTFTDYEKLEEDAYSQYKKIPASIRYQVLPAMKKPYDDRLVFTAMIKKNHLQLFTDLCEYPNLNKSRWKDENGVRTTNVIDALLLLEEDHRMSKETVNG